MKCVSELGGENVGETGEERKGKAANRLVKKEREKN